MPRETIDFIKMQGLGNDFILVDARPQNFEGINWAELAVKICDRHFGVGADGLLAVWPSQKAHYRMQVINPDGSEAEMCGNGIRCFAKYVYEKDKLKEEVISVETIAGIMLPAVILGADGMVAGVEVDLGMPQCLKPYALSLKPYNFNINEVSMGNPHAVIFVDDFSNVDLPVIGPKIENDPHFPNRTNVEFVKVLNDKEIEIMVWERGAGMTLACGTGACASVVAANKAGLTGKRVLAHLPGGNLDIEINEEGHVLMRGPAERVFEGTFYA